MKSTLILATIIAIAQAAPLVNSGGTPIADSYIVILKDGHTVDTFQNKFATFSTQSVGSNESSMYRKFSQVPGFAAKMDKATLKQTLASPEVAYVEQDSLFSITGTQTSPPSWGLPRVSQRNLNLTQPYLYNNAAGSGVTAYVIDTGINTLHTDFGGRAVMGANFITGSPNTDENGHGTHVSGTIGGTKYGVAKLVKLVGVKVLSASGTGSTSGVVAGMDWVAARAVPGRSVVNMSLGGAKSQAMNDAAQRLFAKNIPLIVSAGNNPNTDSCTASPAGAPNTFTVAASDNTDTIASFSSYGSCVEIIAPGVGIVSTWIGSTTATNTLSGTSMASPHVTGVAALYLSFNSLPTAQSVYNKLMSTATPNMIKGSLKGTPNRLVFNGAV